MGHLTASRHGTSRHLTAVTSSVTAPHGHTETCRSIQPRVREVTRHGTSRTPSGDRHGPGIHLTAPHGLAAHLTVHQATRDVIPHGTSRHPVFPQVKPTSRIRPVYVTTSRLACVRVRGERLPGARTPRRGEGGRDVAQAAPLRWRYAGGRNVHAHLTEKDQVMPHRPPMRDHHPARDTTPIRDDGRCTACRAGSHKNCRPRNCTCTHTDLLEKAK